MPFVDQAASSVDKVDNVFIFILVLSAAFLIFITFLMVFFVIKYNKKRSPKGTDIKGHTGLEITWTVVPLILFLSMFYFGWTSYSYLREVPSDAMVITVTGRQWSWQFEYPNGKKSEKLYLAIDRPVRLNVQSADVIHGFYIPAFRIKIDAVPGTTNYTWFTPSQFGAFDIECTVICGPDHSYMLSKAIVVPELDFRKWLEGGEDAPPPAKVKVATSSVDVLPTDPPGLVILKKKQCLTCHSTDGTVMVGPTFKKSFGTKETVRVGSQLREVTRDSAYLAKSIQEPLSEILRGYPSVMPLTPLTQAEVEAVISYIQTLQ